MHTLIIRLRLKQHVSVLARRAVVRCAHMLPSRDICKVLLRGLHGLPHTRFLSRDSTRFMPIRYKGGLSASRSSETAMGTRTDTESNVLGCCSRAQCLGECQMQRMCCQSGELRCNESKAGDLA
jgi:hypothetical protein